jgi:hypothetical protein
MRIDEGDIPKGCPNSNTFAYGFLPVEENL